MKTGITLDSWRKCIDWSHHTRSRGTWFPSDFMSKCRVNTQQSWLLPFWSVHCTERDMAGLICKAWCTKKSILKVSSFLEVLKVSMFELFHTLRGVMNRSVRSRANLWEVYLTVPVQYMNTKVQKLWNCAYLISTPSVSNGFSANFLDTTP